MPDPDPPVQFVLKMALRNALKMVRGLRKEIGDLDEDVMVRKLLSEIALTNYELVRRPDAPGHTFPAPTGPDPHATIRRAVLEAQEVLAAYLTPGGEKDCEKTISAVLGALDHRDLLRAMADTAAPQAPLTPRPGAPD
jgi:hypothetical protein